MLSDFCFAIGPLLFANDGIRPSNAVTQLDLSVALRPPPRGRTGDALVQVSTILHQAPSQIARRHIPDSAFSRSQGHSRPNEQTLNVRSEEHTSELQSLR